MLDLVAIKTDKGYFISDDVKNDSSWFHTQLENYHFDGKAPKETFLKSWFELEKEPKLIERVIPESHPIIAYVLKEGYPVSEKTPQKVELDYFAMEDGYQKNSEVANLYIPIYKVIPEAYESVEFTITEIAHLDNFDRMKVISFTGIERESFADQKVSITMDKFNYSMFDRLVYHPVLLKFRPCALSSEQFYKIIRAHVKDNIDSRYAEITSDYDFCFTVKKKIKLAEKYAYRVDENFNLFAKKRKPPHYVTRYQSERDVTVFETAPKPYQDYTITPTIEAESADALQEKVKKYLDSLMEVINQPIVECDKCLGKGVIFERLKKEENASSTS